MNLLMVMAGLPSSIGGANTRNFHLLEALSKKHNVSLLVSANDVERNESDNISSLNEFASTIQLIPCDVHIRSKRVAQLLSAVRGRSYFLNLFVIPEMQAALDALCSRHHFDIVLFESVLVALRLFLGAQPAGDVGDVEVAIVTSAQGGRTAEVAVGFYVFTVTHGTSSG